MSQPNTPPQTAAQLVLTVHPRRGEISTHRIPLGPKPRLLRVGRLGSCQIAVDDPAVSRQHAAIQASRAGVMLVDLGGRSGIEVNGRPTDRAHLSDGDLLTLGASRIGVEILDAPADPSDRALSLARLNQARMATAPRAALARPPAGDLTFSERFVNQVRRLPKSWVRELGDYLAHMQGRPEPGAGSGSVGPAPSMESPPVMDPRPDTSGPQGGTGVRWSSEDHTGVLLQQVRRDVRRTRLLGIAAALGVAAVLGWAWLAPVLMDGWWVR